MKPAKTFQTLAWFAGLSLACLWPDEAGRWRMDHDYYRLPILRALLAEPMEEGTVATFGSSRTVRAWRPEWVSERLGRPVVNLGLQQGGRVGAYYLLRDLVDSGKAPAVAVVEVNHGDELLTWKRLPDGREISADTKLVPGLVPAGAIPGMAAGWPFGAESLEIIARTASRGPGAAWRHFDYALRGVGWDKDAATVEKAVAADGWEDFAWSGTKATPKAVADRQGWDLDKVLEKRQDYEVLSDDRYRRPRHFANEIAALCEAHDIRLFWVFLPSLMENPLSAEQEQLYGSLGDGVLAMDRPTIQRYFTSPIWHNSGHVSTRGTRFLSRWLADALTTALGD